MKAVLLLSLLFIGGALENLTSISRSNNFKTEAEIAFKKKDYNQAAIAWAKVLEVENNEAVRLNLAHAYYLQGKTLKAAREYQQLIRSATPGVKSVAQLQLGNQLAKTGDYDSALDLYRHALKSDPKNHQARFNYELLLKQQQSENNEDNSEEENPKEEQKEQQREQQQAASQPSGSPKNEGTNGQNQKEGGAPQQINQGDSKGKEAGENNSEEINVDNENKPAGSPGSLPGEATTSQKLQQINMPQDRAQMLLNAMRDAEKQYLQQVPRKPKGRKRLNKPEW